MQKVVAHKNADGKPIQLEEPFFCPTDALKSDVQTLLPLNEVLLRLEEDSGCETNLILLDACRDSVDKSGKGIDGSTIQNLRDKLALFFAAKSGHRSFESAALKHGIFTHYLLEGLRGKAADEDNDITLQSLTSYVSKRVEFDSPKLLDVDKSEAQRPNLMGNLSGTVVLGRKDGKLMQPEPTTNGTPPVAKKSTKSISGAKAGDLRPANSAGIKMVWIPPGSFSMRGSWSKFSTEKQIGVKLTDGFWLGQTEITQGQWTSLMGTSPWKGERTAKEGEKNAASHISWRDAASFVKKLTDQERAAGLLPEDWEYALPTEAQWVYAFQKDLHGGDPLQIFAELSAEDNVPDGWFEANASAVGERFAHEVAKKRPNSRGLFDMYGNVSEWCQDNYAHDLPGGTNPLALTDDSDDRVHRGGCWNDPDQYCGLAGRRGNSPDDRFYYLGFRVALVPVTKTTTK